MNFSRIARQLNEDNPSLAVSADSSEKAKTGGEKQINNTNDRKDRQKAQMAKQTSVPMKSDVSYASEEARRQREMDKMLHNQSSDWRSELIEAAGVDEEGNHDGCDDDGSDDDGSDDGESPSIPPCFERCPASTLKITDGLQRSSACVVGSDVRWQETGIR